MNEGSHQESLKSPIKSAGISRQLVSHCRPVLARWTSAGIQVQCCAFYPVSLLFTNSMTQGWCPSFTEERGREDFMQNFELRDSFKTLLTVGRERLVCPAHQAQIGSPDQHEWTVQAWIPSGQPCVDGLSHITCSVCLSHVEWVSILAAIMGKQSKTKMFALAACAMQRDAVWDSVVAIAICTHIHTEQTWTHTYTHTENQQEHSVSLYRWNRPDTYKEDFKKKKKDCMPWSFLFSYFGLILEMYGTVVFKETANPHHLSY